jgi:putative MATE family efflux protein
MEKSAKFVQGSLMRHIVVMAGTSAFGLTSIFFVDLLDMWFISLLGEPELVAAIGFASTLTFLATSISIGTSIAAGALVSRALGAQNRRKAKDYAINVMIIAALISIVTVIIIIFSLDNLLNWLGAEGRTAVVAKEYLIIVLPAAVFLAVGLAASAVLRAVGDAKGSMMSTLSGGIINAILDPILIFSLSLGVTGAAIASVFARVGVFVYALHRVHFKHKLLTKPSYKSFKTSMRQILNIALPAIVTNTATPLGNAYVTAAIAVYGNSYVAGYAVIGRLTPVCFAFVFSVSGAIGPILGQNYGAQQWDRIKRTLSDSLVVIFGFCAAISVALLLSQEAIINLFKLDSQAADIVSLFCTFLAITFIFNGMLFVSNAVFNNLNSPRLASTLNVGKATVGTIPFVMVGSYFWQAAGVLIGQAVGSILFGILGYWLAKRKIDSMAEAENLG